jgi:hypothetical protein
MSLKLRRLAAGGGNNEGFSLNFLRFIDTIGLSRRVCHQLGILRAASSSGNEGPTNAVRDHVANSYGGLESFRSPPRVVTPWSIYPNTNFVLAR